MEQDRIIAEVAKRNGVLLNRDDPILQINTMLELHAADQQERDAGIVAALSEIRQPAPVGLTDKQVNDLGKMLQQGCAAWADRVVGAATRKSAAIMLATIFGAALLGGVVAWLAFGMPLNPVCVDIQGGGRICGGWTVPPPAAR